MTVNVPKLSPYYMGQLFYYFEYVCYISASILGVDPFDQPGVEAYKKNMFEALGKE
jgi:glucose-6-phosphate isomerase